MTLKQSEAYESLRNIVDILLDYKISCDTKIHFIRIELELAMEGENQSEKEVTAVKNISDALNIRETNLNKKLAKVRDIALEATQMKKYYDEKRKERLRPYDKTIHQAKRRTKKNL